MGNAPILLRPTGKDYLWGGQRLNRDFEKNIPLRPLAETWECSTHPDGPSYARGGVFDGMCLADILCAHPEFLGTRHEGEKGLPILVKFIDARQNLSVQVHPNDDYAREHENGQLGKTEMWYVLDAARDTRLIYGLNWDTDRDTLSRAIRTGTVEKYLQAVPIAKNDVFFIPAGTIHAIGAGALIAEIQENSNLTYRLYDYDRRDKDGKKRQLHIDKALSAANLRSSAAPRQPLRVLRYRPGCASELLCRCKYFEVHRLLVSGKTGYQAEALAFRVLLCLEGEGEIACAQGSISFRRGDCVFVPADSEAMTICARAQLLDIRG